jgi:hypothetical protein
MIEKQIVPDNKKAIEAAINAVQHSRDTGLLSYSDLEEAAKIAESMLQDILKKQDRQNVKALVRPSYPAFSPTYRGIPTHTQCYIRRGKKDWYMYDAARTHANRAGSYSVVIDLDSLEPKHCAIINCVTQSLKGDTILKQLSCV